MDGRKTMAGKDILEGKRILIVDDEPDVLDTLAETLNMCLVDKAPSFDAGVKFLNKNTYDIAILDIMGVQGYDLLKMATQENVSTVMLTGHALSPANLIRSIKEGADSYVPKDKLPEIADFLRDTLEAKQRGSHKQGRWFWRLKPFFDKVFGSGWREKDRDFWNDFDAKHTVSKKDLEEML
jgi:DNA-binding NtrC family response regulator